MSKLADKILKLMKHVKRKMVVHDNQEEHLVQLARGKN